MIFTTTYDEHENEILERKKNSNQILIFKKATDKCLELWPSG